MSTTFEFLDAVLPDAGFFCLAAELPDGKREHKVFDTVEEAAAFAERESRRRGVHFAPHSLAERRVWNEAEQRYQTRTKLNVKATRCFYFDLDVRHGAPDAEHYGSQREAVAAMEGFCADTGLPLPMFINSGHGVHVYWIMDRDIPAADWRGPASLLKMLAKAKGLRPDPERTNQTGVLMRLPGTVNFKAEPVPVKVVTWADPIDADAFIAKLSELAQQAGISGELGLPVRTDIRDHIEFDGAPVDAQGLLSACAQVRAVARTRGNCSRGTWMQMIATLRHITDGRKIAHKFSSGYPNYSAEEVDREYDAVEAKGVGPTTCAVWAASGDPALCAACPFQGVTNPLCAARKPQVAAEAPTLPTSAAPTLQPAAPAAPITPELPMPDGYVAASGGGVIHRRIVEGKLVETKIFDGSLYPLMRQVCVQEDLDQHEWACHLPNEPPKTFVLRSSVISNIYLLRERLANHGIYVLPAHEKSAQNYMSLYIKSLSQKYAPVNVQAHLGWIEGHSKFVLPDVTLDMDGNAVPTKLSAHIRPTLVTERSIGKIGTLAAQKSLMRAYEGPENEAQQFFILASLASPIFYMTGHHGTIVHAQGERGAAKSTLLGYALSMWGHPERMPLSGLKGGATVVGRDIYARMLGSYPLGLDEITNIAEDVAEDFALGVSQPNRGKMRGQKDREAVRETHSDPQDNLVLSTGNISLHNMLSRGSHAGDAAIMRIFEIHFPVLAADKEAQLRAQRAFGQLAENYGHIGEAFICYVMTNAVEVKMRVIAMVEKLIRESRLDPGHRFWPSTAASVIVAGEIAAELGLLNFDTRAIYRWVVDVQFPLMASVVLNPQDSAAETMTSYLFSILTDCCLTMSEANTSALNTPKNQLKARYESGTRKYFITREAFRDWCRTRKINANACITALRATGVVEKLDERKVLTAGSLLPAARAWCHIVRADHEALAGAISTVETAGRAGLRLIDGGLGAGK